MDRSMAIEDRAASSAPDRPRRAVLTVDLGSTLRTAVAERATAEGLRVSDVVRQAVQEHIAGGRELRADRRGDQQPEGGGQYQPHLDAKYAAKLDELKLRTGRRTRHGVLRALIDGIDLAPAAGGLNLGAAVQQLIRSNAELVAIGRNLNQVAHSLNLYPGKTTATDRQAIERTITAVYGHLEVAARLAAEVRPLVRLPDEPPTPPRRPRSTRKAATKKSPGEASR
jgi:hypothetical protein